MAVNRFTGAVSSAWNNAGNWSQGTVPTAADGHVATFDATSPACTLSGNRVANHLDLSAAVNAITFATFNLTVSGDVGLGPNATFVFSTGVLQMDGAAGTLTPNGRTLDAAHPTLRIAGAGAVVVTLAADVIVAGGTFDLRSAGSTATINGNSIRVRNNGTLTTTRNNVTGVVLGTAVIRFDDPSGASSASFSTAALGRIALEIVFETAGLVIIGAVLGIGGQTITYTSGTVITTASTLNIRGSGLTTVLDTDGIVWNAVTNITSGSSTTLTSDLNIAGLFDPCSTSDHTYNGPGQINASGGVTLNGATRNCLGSAKLNMTGGTYTGATGTGSMRLSMDLNGPVTISPTQIFRYALGTLRYVSGAVVTTDVHLMLAAVGATTFDVGALSWAQVTLSAGNATTVTLTGHLDSLGLMTIGHGSGATVINGPGELRAHADVVHSGTAPRTHGTAVLRMMGTGSYTPGSDPAGSLELDWTIDAGVGTVTIGVALGNPVKYSGSFRHVSGTVVANLVDFQLKGIRASSFDTDGAVAFGRVRFPAAFPTTLLSDLALETLEVVATVETVTIDGPGGLLLSGDLEAATLTTGTLAGTSEIVKSGSGTLTTGLTGAGMVDLPIRVPQGGDGVLTLAGATLRASSITIEADEVRFAGFYGWDVDSWEASAPDGVVELTKGILYRARASAVMNPPAGSGLAFRGVD